MTQPNSETRTLGYVFSIVLTLSIVIYLLRGFGVLTSLPGAVYLVLFLLSIVTGLAYGVQKTRRY
ncbi:hypothetical protein H6F77_20040 [Microcoleus sp. FACHB-831]|uniref:hypothetical protein n=1 Tax=Microcoleus sp. FACHB-831 TaxID=2692827 RepID=UPI001684AB7D|nr:hypothetical protein [Microcoleus sp. FACHB-831]MBD1923343.1 hypothetical protein [Microcoleus sp. FACHB-831]